MTRKAHVLYEGYLLDAPGRNESWTEYVTYLGSNRWRLVSKGTSFDGGEAGEAYAERMGTQPLIKWCLQRDAEGAESAAFHSIQSDETAPDDEEDDTVKLGDRAVRLIEIAREEDAAFCVACLEGLVAGTWPPKQKTPLPVPRILSIDGVTRRGVWLGVYRPAYIVETTHGPGYMEAPGGNGYATVFLRSGAVSSAARSARIPKRLMPQLKNWQAEFEALKASLMARSSGAVQISGEEN